MYTAIATGLRGSVRRRRTRRVWAVASLLAVAFVTRAATSRAEAPEGGIVLNVTTVPFREGEIISSAAFSPDGKLLATLGSAGTLYLWEVGSGDLRFKIEPPKFLEKYALFSRDWSALATVGRGGTIHLWDVGTGRHRFKVDSPSFAGRAVEFSPDGRWLLTVAGSGKIHLWNVATGGHRYKIESAKFGAFASFSPDARRLATVARDGTVHLWDVETGRHRFKIEAATFGDFAAFSPDARRLVTVAEDRTLHLWDVGTGRHVFKIDAPKYIGLSRPPATAPKAVGATVDSPGRPVRPAIAIRVAAFSAAAVMALTGSRLKSARRSADRERPTRHR